MIEPGHRPANRVGLAERVDNHIRAGPLAGAGPALNQIAGQVIAVKPLSARPVA
ncbi:hypothetical protein [Paractinoplanes brasiliensis]|uniref:hypothetical protein n=1 Tax=Paractinoplanes brasiliensis TaxID=52695 RepID=UPI0014152091|nr:hypothetical protein [Actinoplanes brasiliensis]GID30967.1 hypothetical protein Abr02nite_59500 [Actinoplanes brasiliensis]